MLEMNKKLFEVRINEIFDFYLLTSKTKLEHLQNFEKEAQEELNKFNRENGLNKGFRFKDFWTLKMKSVKWQELKNNR